MKVPFQASMPPRSQSSPSSPQMGLSSQHSGQTQLESLQWGCAVGQDLCKWIVFLMVTESHPGACWPPTGVRKLLVGLPEFSDADFLPCLPLRPMLWMVPGMGD